MIAGPAIEQGIDVAAASSRGDHARRWRGESYSRPTPAERPIVRRRVILDDAIEITIQSACDTYGYVTALPVGAEVPAIVRRDELPVTFRPAVTPARGVPEWTVLHWPGGWRCYCGYPPTESIDWAFTAKGHDHLSAVRFAWLAACEWVWDRKALRNRA